MKKLIYLIGFIALGTMISCENETEVTPFPETQKLVDVTGQWNVTAYNDSTVISGPFTILTLSDPSSESDSITIQDSEVKFWKFQVKSAVDKTNGTFETKLSSCEVSEEGIGVKITNGKIIHTDSIYFEIQFEDDETPYGNTYQLKGHRVKG